MWGSLLAFFICVSFGAPAHSKPLHILHTNDLHSYFNGYANGGGGYARLKRKMDELREYYRLQGIETLTVDGGDFGEGTSYFLAGGGLYSLGFLGQMGVEASVIGNHDYMMGGPVLARQIRAAAVSTRFLSANIFTTPQMELQNVLTARADFIKNGIRISVVGFSTPEVHYQYPLLPDGLILPPLMVAPKESQKARSEGADLVIALTHIGVKADRKLAAGTSEIDLIIGGHSHTRIDQPLWVNNQAGRPVPIVQAKAHGLALGSMLLDVEGPGKFKVLDYRLHDIAAPMPEDPAIQTVVDEAVAARDQLFKGRFHGVVGESRIQLSGYVDGDNPNKTTCWGSHMARMARQATGSDVGIHLAVFEGVAVDPGKITFGNLVDNFPHVRKAGDPGWEAASFRVKGSTIKLILDAIINLNHQMGVSFDGLTYRAVRVPAVEGLDPDGDGKWVIPYHLRINGKRVLSKKMYTIAFPSEVIFALKTMLPGKIQKLFPGLEYSGKFMWDIMEAYVRIHSPLRCL
jgi:2',3'-cyclic-nucleotide 2'-phosphodiesterase (5'-nucleotidase family)